MRQTRLFIAVFTLSLLVALPTQGQSLENNPFFEMMKTLRAKATKSFYETYHPGVDASTQRRVRTRAYSVIIELDIASLSREEVQELKDLFFDHRDTAEKSNFYYTKLPYDSPKDSLSYTIILKTLGDVEGEDITHSVFLGNKNIPNTPDCGVTRFAALDISNTIRFQYYDAFYPKQVTPADWSPIDNFIQTLSKQEGVVNQEVRYKINDRMPRYSIFSGGKGDCVGTKYIVPAASAQKYWAEANDIADNCKTSEQNFDIYRNDNVPWHPSDIAILDYKSKEAFVFDVANDGKLYLLRLKTIDGSLFIPAEWKEITIYEDKIE